MKNLKELEVWFATGSQHLYGEETLKQVAAHSREIVGFLDEQETIPVKIIFKPILKSSEEIFSICQEANNTKNCIGLIAWMHTFSPAKMWIGGLKILHKPLMHLHTQFNRDIPWKEIDMDFMNLNQSAHGDREFGFIMTRMRLERKVVVGHWRNEKVVQQTSIWARAACAWHDWQGAKFVRFGDNMRYVAVTDGDKVEAEIKFGYSVNTHGIGDLAAVINNVREKEIDNLVEIYNTEYKLAASLKKDARPNGSSGREDKYQSLRDAAKIEIGLRKFLRAGNFKGFTDTFEDLHGLAQLPGIAVQRLMRDGYGFAAEGDWKTAALVRAMKVMSHGLNGGTSFMEDYTYHLKDGGQVLGAHMLEVCPSIADDKPSAEIHPLSIGGKGDPVRLVFTASSGRAVNASIVDIGNRFRLVVNQVNLMRPEQPLPKLPVARAIWVPEPNLK